MHTYLCLHLNGVECLVGNTLVFFHVLLHLEHLWQTQVRRSTLYDEGAHHDFQRCTITIATSVSPTATTPPKPPTMLSISDSVQFNSDLVSFDFNVSYSSCDPLAEVTP